MNRTLNKAIRLFHVWAGILLGAAFCLMSISGSVLVLRPVIEDSLRPTWTRTSSARPDQPLNTATNNILRLWPGAKVASLSLPANPEGPVEFTIRSGHNDFHVFADPHSGEVLGTFDLAWMKTLTDLHHHILIDSIGKKIVGFIGLFLVVSSLTGLVIWARRVNRWKLLGARGAAIWQYSKFDWHRALGVVGNAALLFVAITGVMMAFPQTLTRKLGGARQATPKTTQHHGADQPLAEYIHAAQSAVPDGTVGQLKLERGRIVTARVRVPGDLRLDGSARVYLEPGTATILAVDNPNDWPIAQRIVEAATPFHYAEWGGLTLRLIWCFIGLIPPVLFVSGLIMWWAPYAAKRKAAHRAAFSPFSASQR